MFEQGSPSGKQIFSSFSKKEIFTATRAEVCESKEEPEPIENIVISDNEDLEEKFGDQHDFLQYFHLASRTGECLPIHKQSIV